MATELDSLVINISANVSGANKGLNNLRKNLSSLQTFVNEKLDTKAIDLLQEHLQRIADIDFSNVSRGLQDVVSAFRSFQNKAFVKATQGGVNLSGSLQDTEYKPPIVDFSSFDSNLKSIKEALSSYHNALSSTNEEMLNLGETSVFTSEQLNHFDGTLGEINKNLQDAIYKNEELASAMENLGFNGSQIENVLATIGKENESLTSEQIQDVADAMERLGYSAEQVSETVKRLSKGIKDMGNKGKEAGNKWVNAFKRIVFYRVIRRTIQLIAQSIGEGIKELAQFDSGFNTSISNIINSLKYISNSIVAFLNPIIQLVEPFITMVATTLGDIINMLGSMVSGALGNDTFAEATKGADDYAESLKKVKNVQLGIDELNVVQQDNQTSLFNNKDIEKSNDLKNIITELKNELQPVLEKVKGIFTALKPIVDLVFKVVGRFFDMTDESVNESVGAFMETLMNIVNLISTILDALDPIIEIVNVVLALGINIINDGLTTLSRLISSIVKSIKPIVSILEPIIDVIAMIVDVIVGLLGGALKGVFSAINTIVEFIVAVFDTLVAVFTLNFNKIGDIWKNLGERLKNIWKGVGNFFIDVLNAMITAIEKVVNFGINTVGKIAELFGADTSGWGVHINRIPHLSSGGFVEDGFFFANHNELVGQFANGQTAVANNEQITEGIYRAVLQAMNDSNGGGKEIVLQVDGREIGRVAEKYNAQKGDKEIFVGGYHYGY